MLEFLVKNDQILKMILVFKPQTESMQLSYLSRVIMASHRYHPPVWRQHAVYKFTKRKYMDAFFDTGSIKIGTLHGYQDTEKYGGGVADNSEGKSRTVQYVKTARSVEAGSFLSKFIDIQGGVVKNSVFIESRSSPDAFLFCAAAFFNEELFKLWNIDQGYDACYEIFDVPAFRDAISRKIPSALFDSFGAYPSYVDGDVYFHSELRHVHPATIKQKEFEWQKEYREIWMPKHPLTHASELYLNVPDATQYCRKFATWESGAVHYLKSGRV